MSVILQKLYFACYTLCVHFPWQMRFSFHVLKQQHLSKSFKEKQILITFALVAIVSRTLVLVLLKLGSLALDVVSLFVEPRTESECIFFTSDGPYQLKPMPNPLFRKEPAVSRFTSLRQFLQSCLSTIEDAKHNILLVSALQRVFYTQYSAQFQFHYEMLKHKKYL